MWGCDRHEHSEHTYTELELTAGAGSLNRYVCANSGCTLSDSGSDSSWHLPVGSDAYQRAFAFRAFRAFRALHWNHSVSLGIGGVPTEAPSTPTSWDGSKTPRRRKT